MFVDMPHPVIGDMKVNGCPIKLMDTMPQIKTPAPTLGQDNIEILQQIGYSNRDIENLKQEHII